MKWLFHPPGITVIVVILILSLPFFLPEEKIIKLSDNALRQTALSRNMLPVPKGYEALLKVVDTPENPMSREKIALGKALFLTAYSHRIKPLAAPHVII